MQSLTEAVDLLQSRARDFLYADNVHTVYALIGVSSTIYYVQLDRIVTPMELSRLSMKYQRLYSDLLDRYDFKVINSDYTLRRTDNLYKVYERGNGYSVTVRLQDTGRNF